MLGLRVVPVGAGVLEAREEGGLCTASKGSKGEVGIADRR